MFQRILVPLDGSPGAERAIAVAASLVRGQHGSLVFLHIVTPEIACKSAGAPLQKAGRTDRASGSEQATSAHNSSQEIQRAEALEQRMVEAASYLALLPVRYADSLAGLKIEMHLAFGRVPPTLPSTVRLEHVDLIVLCRHREVGLGRWGLEQVAQEVMRHSPVPVLIVHEGELAMPILDGAHALRVVVPLDGTLFAESALEPALGLLSQGAAAGQRELCLLHVVDLFADEGTGDEETHRSPYITMQARQVAWRYLQMVVDRLRTGVGCPPDVRLVSQVTSGVDVASSILFQREHMSERESDRAGGESSPVPSLVVIATHGREGMQYALLGSVAERLLDATTAPVMTVCPGKTKMKLFDIALPAESRK